MAIKSLNPKSVHVYADERTSRGGRRAAASRSRATNGLTGRNRGGAAAAAADWQVH